MQPPYGEPGTVVRIERNRAVVLWLELDYLARHSLASLTETANQSMIGRQGADVAQSSGDNGRNREASCRTMPSLCFGSAGARTIAHSSDLTVGSDMKSPAGGKKPQHSPNN